MSETGIYWEGGQSTTIRRIGNFLRNVVSDHSAHIAEQIHARAVELSPVRTGQYRASWKISIGSPDYNDVNSGGEGGSPLPAPPSVAPSHSRLSLQSFYVSNGRYYAPYIEYGTPHMAAQRVLARAIQSVVG